MTAVNRSVILTWTSSLSIIAVILWNYFANSGGVYNLSIKDISDKYTNLFTPAGFTFAIWGVIYIGMMAVAVAQIIRPKLFPLDSRKWSVLLIVQSVFNGLWINFFLLDMPSIALITIVLLLASLLILLRQIQFEEQVSSWVKIVIGLYAGWVSAATIANAAVACTAIEWVPFALDPVIWYKIMIVTTGLLGILVFSKWRNLAYIFALAWALFGIAMARSNETILFQFASIASIAMLITCLAIKLRGWQKTKQLS